METTLKNLENPLKKPLKNRELLVATLYDKTNVPERIPVCPHSYFIPLKC